jgi:hypothetical protein
MHARALGAVKVAAGSVIECRSWQASIAVEQASNACPCHAVQEWDCPLTVSGLWWAPKEEP